MHSHFQMAYLPFQTIQVLILVVMEDALAQMKNLVITERIKS